MSTETLIKVTIQGMPGSSLLQHRFFGAMGATADETPAQAAEACCYRDEAGYLWQPGASIAAMLRESAHRESLDRVVVSAVIIQEDRIPLFNTKSGAERERLTTFQLDSRPVVVPSTGVRTMRHRPRLNEWSADFGIAVNEDVLDLATVRLLLIRGGSRIGIGDFRPSRGGSFGRFLIKDWQIVQ